MTVGGLRTRGVQVCPSPPHPSGSLLTPSVRQPRPRTEWGHCSVPPTSPHPHPALVGGGAHCASRFAALRAASRTCCWSRVVRPLSSASPGPSGKPLCSCPFWFTRPRLLHPWVPFLLPAPLVAWPLGRHLRGAEPRHRPLCLFSPKQFQKMHS